MTIIEEKSLYERRQEMLAQVDEEPDKKKTSGPTQASVFEQCTDNELLMNGAIWRQERNEWWIKRSSGIWQAEDCEQVQGSIHSVISGLPDWQIGAGTTSGLLTGVKMLLRPVLAKPPSIFDRDPWLFGVGNGIVDLHNQTLIENADEHYITRCSPFDYVPGSESEELLNHLDMMFDGDDDLAHCFQKQMGAALVGDAETSKPQVFIQLIGPSGGGKGTLTHLLRFALGSYATNMDSKDFAEGQDRHKQWLTVLNGVRLAIVEEQRTQALDIEQLKKLSGGDPVIANEMRQADKEWFATHTLLFTSNTAPNFGDDADGFSRRYVPLPTGPERWLDDKDGKYARNLRKNPEGILAWLLEGTRMWQEEDHGALIALPPSVIELRDAHIAGHSEYQSFIDECLIFDRNEMMHRSEVRPLFSNWLVKQGDLMPVDKDDKRLKKVYDILDRHVHTRTGQPSIDGKQGRGWFGVSG
jgi:P4 family phage/plasmid primase-like protien